MIYHGVILTDVMARLRFRPMGAYRVANVLREAGYNILVIDMYSTLSIAELKILLDKTITKETLFSVVICLFLCFMLLMCKSILYFRDGL